VDIWKMWNLKILNIWIFDILKKKIVYPMLNEIRKIKLIFLNSLKSISQIIKIKLLEDIINEQSHFV